MGGPTRSPPATATGLAAGGDTFISAFFCENRCLSIAVAVARARICMLSESLMRGSRIAAGGGACCTRARSSLAFFSSALTLASSAASVDVEAAPEAQRVAHDVPEDVRVGHEIAVLAQRRVRRLRPEEQRVRRRLLVDDGRERALAEVRARLRALRRRAGGRHVAPRRFLRRRRRHAQAGREGPAAEGQAHAHTAARAVLLPTRGVAGQGAAGGCTVQLSGDAAPAGETWLLVVHWSP